MNADYLNLFLNKTNFTSSACETIFDSASKIDSKDLSFAVFAFYKNGFKLDLISPLLNAISESSGENIYTVNLLFLIECSVNLREKYKKTGIEDSIFWDTMEDLRFKADECMTIHGVWGNFVISWYPIFYSLDILKLGRLEYEKTHFDRNNLYEKSGIFLSPGDFVLSVHIPSCGPLDKQSRMTSYRLAYDFFKNQLNGKPLALICDSWLLYPPNREILQGKTNIVDFMNDFDIIEFEEKENFKDMWRIFGKDEKKPIAQLPEDTFLQLQIKNWLKKGKKMGDGYGVLIFDGEKILNK